MHQLDTNDRDRLVSVTKGISGALPFVGTMVGELLDSIVPNLRFERVVEYLKTVDEEVGILKEQLDNFEKSIKTEEGIDIFEEGIIQASRAVSTERKYRLARLVTKSLSADKLKYEESRKLLNLYAELTDPEIVWLIYYSLNPNMGQGAHTEFQEKHPDILKPIRAHMGSSQDAKDKFAIQESYKSTLMRLGLLKTSSKHVGLSSLGRLLIRYIENEAEESNNTLHSD